MSRKIGKLARFRAELVAADLTLENRTKILDRQDGRCFYCDKNIDGRRYVLDHFMPRHAGGAHDISNRVAACPPCDMEKGGRLPTPEEHKKFFLQKSSMDQN